LTNPEDLQTQLQKTLAEYASLREENERLKKLLGLPPEQIVPPHELIISEPTSLYTTTVWSKMTLVDTKVEVKY